VIDTDFEAAEVGETGDPGERFATKSSCEERLEKNDVALGTVQEFFGLLVGRDEPGVA
jgi:hypothetical protein